jgi:hypothetical protein
VAGCTSDGDSLQATGSQPVYCDVNSDGYLTPLDAVRVINVLNDPVSQAEGEVGGNLVPGLIVAVGHTAASQDTAGLRSLSPTATTSSGAIVQRRDEVLSVWATPTVEEELLDSLATDRRSRFMDGDAETDEETGLLSVEELLGDVAGDHFGKLMRSGRA